MKIIHATDLHFSHKNKNTINILNEFIKQITENHFDSQLIVLSGDIINGDSNIKKDYEYIFSELNNTGIPFIISVGNHDDRPALSHLLKTEMYKNCYLNFKMKINGLNILSIDTCSKSKINEKHGYVGNFDFEQSEWVKNNIDIGTPTVLVMHYNPLAIHTKFMQNFHFDNTFFLNTISNYDSIKHILFGHVHACCNCRYKHISMSSPGSLYEDISINSGKNTCLIDKCRKPSYDVITFDSLQNGELQIVTQNTSLNFKKE